MMRYYLVAVLLLIPNIAWASEGDPVWWQVALAHMLQIVITIVTPTLVLLARKLVLAAVEKSGLEASERHLALVDALVNQGISYAHEQGRKALKQGSTIPADERKKAAVDFIAAELEATGLAYAGSEQLEKLVEAKLNMRRDDPKKKGKFVVSNNGRSIAKPELVQTQPQD